MATNTTTSEDKKVTTAFRGSRTETNVMNAYLAECESYARYTFYAKQAGKDKYYPVQQIFKQVASNEMHHAKVFFKMLQGGETKVTVDAMLGTIGDTADNLRQAMKAEYDEGVVAYTEFAAIADEEGFTEIADHFRAISMVESKHYVTFGRYLKMIEDGTMWKRPAPITWRCLVCGYEYKGTEPPETCPGCDHPYQHYMAMDDIEMIIPAEDD